LNFDPASKFGGLMRPLLFLFALTLNFLSSSAMAETPLVPINSVLYHWDHHWYIWLPGDPVYEAVEVMAAERGPSDAPLVWVFFTEREGAKHQTHYLNDARIAAVLGGQTVDIAFKMTGAEGGSRGLSVAFKNNKGQSVAIDVEVNTDAPLRTEGGGLTNQIGHSADRLFLIFFREKAAFADKWRVLVDDVNVAATQPGQNHSAPFPAAYSHNIFVGGFPFGERRVAFDGHGANEDLGIVHFARASDNGPYTTTLRDRSRIELDATQDDALHAYRQSDPTGDHTLEITFNPPVPGPNRIASEVDSAFSISLDDFRNLLSGSAHVIRHDDAVKLEWRFDQPEWARARPLLTSLALTNGDVSRIEVHPMQ
jgi:hypothetical protein